MGTKGKLILGAAILFFLLNSKAKKTTPNYLTVTTDNVPEEDMPDREVTTGGTGGAL